ncbi:hypothetical protein ASJ30_06290 [Janibacter indicus]|uniref:DUF4829 domain-containing protein n=1 Tax=Janibacter indicus TaxID=857417 RepID=A0A1L3MFR8_9MICO|nr:hypothetical protein [Janibacter indicus]APH01201.1 hypothetical protein ASJ30_06290 [Janibacter indicus]
MSRWQWLTVVVVTAVVLGGVGGYVLVAPRGQVPVPTAQATPEEVARAWIDASNARDLDTMRAIVSEERAEHFVPSYVDLLSQRDLIVAEDSIGNARAYNRTGTRLGDWRQVQYVPVQFRVLQSDGSFSATSRTSWGYVFARNGDDERWRLVDQGVG